VIKRRYSINKINFIRQALSGYVGNDAIVSELLQNADDAKATHVSFYLQPNALEVHNNSTFTEQDFTNILDIASGGKRRDTEKIGTWGTGFLSVFHITDCPELESNGIHLIFDPNLDELDERSSSVKHETVFRLPWRRTQTELAKSLEAKVWVDDDIRQLKEKMLQTLYGLILFLRYVRTIEVFSEEGGKQPQLILRVHMKEEPINQLTFGVRQSRTIEYKDTHSSRTDEWLFYKNSVPAEYLPKGVTAKDRRIELALPRKSTEWLKKNLPGSLYNFLPTPILTGFPFQVNGSFFPDNNRRHILLDEGTQPEKARWNHAVIAALGKLFVDAVEDIRDQVKEPVRFYELLPLKKPVAEYLHPIREQFVREAKDRAIVFHSQSKWGTPRQVHIGNPGSTLPQLVASELPVVPEGTPQVFRDFLFNELNVSRLHWEFIAKRLIHQGLKPGIKLAQAPAMINTVEKLEKFYTELQQYRKGFTESDLLHQLPLCLDQTATLWNFVDDGVRRGNPTERKLLSNTKVRFVADELQEKYAPLLNELVPEVRGTDAVEALAAETWPVRPLTLATLKGRLVTNFDDLFALLKFIHRDLSHINADQLAKLPIVRDADDRLFCPADEAVYLNKPISVLRRLGYTFLHPHFADDSDIMTVYRKAKNLPLSPTAVIKQLHKLPDLLAQKSIEEKIDLLTKLYQYFIKTPEPLSPPDKLWLRGIPLCITSKGNLRPAHDGKTVLHLHSSSHDTSPELEHLNKLQLDDVVDSRLMTADSARFLTEVLGIEVLSTENLIRDVIVNHYHDPQFNVDTRRDLLRYIGIKLQQLPVQVQSQLTAKLANKRLIECQDGVYRYGTEIYFPSPELDELFPAGYSTPHADYSIPLDNGAGTNGQSQWHWLFFRLGINENAQTQDIIKEIREIVDYNPPAEVYIDRLRPLYQYLMNQVGKFIALDDSNLHQLKTLAWLPASGDHRHWFRPGDIYPISLSSLVGTQAHLLIFKEPTKDLREVLQMPGNPPPMLVVNHLRALAQQKKPVSPNLYIFLEQHHAEVPVAELKWETIIWDKEKEKFWKPEQVFFGSFGQKFGARRGYFKSPGGEFQGFLERLGVRSNFTGSDSLRLIEEIADEYGDTKPLSKTDLDLFAEHFDELSSLLSTGDNPQLRAELKRLAMKPIVPDPASRLHIPDQIASNDWPDALRQFEESSIPIVHEHFVEYALISILGVQLMSRIVKRIIEDAPKADDNHHMASRLRGLAHAFRRIDLNEQQYSGFSRDPAILAPDKQLQAVNIFICQRLEVSYSIDNGHGWKIKGQRRDEQAIYDISMKVLYIKQSGKYGIEHSELAQELVRVLFPELPPNHLSPIVETILDKAEKSMYEVDRFLDKHHYPRLPNEGRVRYDETIDNTFKPTEWTEEEVSPSKIESIAPPLTPSKRDAPHTYARQVSLFDKSNLSTLPESVSNQTDEQNLDVNPQSAMEIARPIILPIPQLDRTIDTPAEQPINNNGIHKDIPSTGSVTTDAQVSVPPKAQSLPRQTISTLPEGAAQSPARSIATAQPMANVDHLPKIPVFTGRLRPVVPQSSNDYVGLRHKYQTSSQSVALESKNDTTRTGIDYSEDDAKWNDFAHVQDKIGDLYDNNERAVSVVRFTLTYQNRIEGFLPLHGRARLMLRERPIELRCKVDFNESEFSLYVDYERGILYNQTKLKELFEAYNIPAGGIIYLQHVHAKTVQLFWKQSNNSLKKVQLLEFQEDGHVEMLEIPEVDYPCEIDEYVVRAEKRLEDPLALFAKALEAGGLFEIMCNVFEAAGKELSYAEIFQGVSGKRPFADGSIRFQLHQRPCFVQIEHDRWRFEPNREFGFLPPATDIENRPQSNKLITSTRFNSNPLSEQINRFDTHSNGEVVIVQSWWTSPYTQVLEHSLSELKELLLLLETNIDPKNRLQKFLSLLEQLLKRLTQDFSAVNAEEGEKDDLLDQLWQKVQHSPNHQQPQTDLYDFLLSQTDERMQRIVQQTKSLLANTSFNLREVVFFGLIAQVAEKAIEQDLIEQARSWYHLLQEQQTGDFSIQLQQLEKADAIRQAIIAIQSAPNLNERWLLCHKAWQQYPGNAQVLKVIQAHIRNELKSIQTQVGPQTKSNEILQAYKRYRKLLEELNSIKATWEEIKLANKITALGQQIYEKLVLIAGKPAQMHENWNHVWHLSVRMPSEGQKALLGATQLVAAQVVAHRFYENGGEIEAIAILEYAKYGVQASDRQIDDKAWCTFYETLSNHYEQRGIFDLASKYLSAARQRASSPQKSQYNAHQNALDAKKKKQDPILKEVLRERFDGLLNERNFQEYIDVSVFKQMCEKFFKDA